MRVSLCLRDEEASGSPRAARHSAIPACPLVLCAAELSRTGSRRRRCAAPRPALPAPGSALGPPGAPAPSSALRHSLGWPSRLVSSRGAIAHIARHLWPRLSRSGRLPQGRASGSAAQRSASPTPERQVHAHEHYDLGLDYQGASALCIRRCPAFPRNIHCE